MYRETIVDEMVNLVQLDARHPVVPGLGHEGACRQSAGLPHDETQCYSSPKAVNFKWRTDRLI